MSNGRPLLIIGVLQNYQATHILRKMMPGTKINYDFNTHTREEYIFFLFPE